MRIGNHFKRLQAPEGKVHYRKHLNLQRYTLAEGSIGTDYTAITGGGVTPSGSLIPSGHTEIDITAVPQTSYIYVRTNINAIARMVNDPTDIFRRSVEMSLAEGVDYVCAGKAIDLTNVVGSNADNITEPLLQDAIVKAAVSMKMEFNPGQDELLFGMHPNQIDDILGIANWVQAQVRGDGENPVVRGMVLRANGVQFVETGNINSTGGNTYNNPIFVPNVTFGIGFNQEATVKMEDYLMEKRIVGWVDFAVLTLWDNYGVNYKTTIAA